MAESFRCTLITPERQVLDEDVVYASLPAWDGQLGVMHLRAPLVVKLGQGVLRLDYPGSKSRFFYVGGGFAQVKDDKLLVLTREAVAAEDVDPQAVAAARRDADARPAHTTTDVEAKRRQVTRAQALAELATRKP